MKVLLAFYSRSGATARAARIAADELRKAGAEVTVFRISERFDLPYPLWLLLSFIPGCGWPIMGRGPDLAGFNGLFLLTPKWTLACPPVETWLRRVGGKGARAALAVTCGGFDEERYAKVYAGKLTGRGFDLAAVATVKKRKIATPETREAMRAAAEALVNGITR